MRNDPVLGFPVSGGTALVRMELAVFLIFQSTHPVRGGTAKMHKTSPRLMNLCDKNASEEALSVKQKHCFCKILHKSMRKTGANLPGFSRELAVR